MSNVTSTATSINTASEAAMPSITVQQNSQITYDMNSASEVNSPLNYRNPNVVNKSVEVIEPNTEKTDKSQATKNLAYREEIVNDENTRDTYVAYKPVALPPAIYKRNQTLESVVAANDVIVPLTRAEYVTQYRVAEARSAREILTMCRLVYEASKSLDSAEFNAFCRDIGYKDYSSVIRKLTVIGKIQPRLIAHADVLPASWSSIYALTQIPAQAFENMIHMNRSFKEMTVSEVSKLVKATRDLNKLDDIIKPALMTAEEKNDKILDSTVLAKVYFTKIPDDLDWHTFEKALLEVQANLPVRIQFLSPVKELFTERKDKRYEKLKVKQAPSPYKPEAWDMGREVTKMSTTPLNYPDAAMTA